MKMLKKHGKKVSVILLAMALAVTPMLPVVKAADDDTCEIRNHYFFIEEETAYIDTVYKLTETGKTANKSEDTFNVRQYSSQYAVQFGFDSDDMKNNATFDANAQSAKMETGVIVAYDTKDPNQSKSFGGIIPDQDKFKNWLNQATKIEPVTNLTMTSTASFYNTEIPEGFEFKGASYDNWSKDDWYLFTDMYIKAYKNGKATNGTFQEDYALNEVDGDYYFIHNSWQNRETEGDSDGHYLNSPTGWRDSDTTGNMDMFAQWAANGKTINDSEVTTQIDKWMKASIDINKGTTSQRAIVPDEAEDFEHIGDPNYSTVGINLKRVYGDLSGYKNNLSNMLWKGATQTIKGEDFEGGIYSDYIDHVEDTYYYYLFPTMLTLTYEGHGDVCTVDTGKSKKKLYFIITFNKFAEYFS